MIYRPPGDLSHALNAAYLLLGYPRLRALTGKSEALLRAWADPDDDSRRISLDMALAIDDACHADCGRRPIREFIAAGETAAPAVGDAAVCAGQVASDLAALMQASAKLGNDYAAAAADGTITYAERVLVAKSCQQLEAQLATLRRRCMPQQDDVPAAVTALTGFGR